jgi:hypothetical protein
MGALSWAVPCEVAGDEDEGDEGKEEVEGGADDGEDGDDALELVLGDEGAETVAVPSMGSFHPAWAAGGICGLSCA